MKVMSGILCPSTTSRTVVSASSLCVAPVCDLTLHVCVLHPVLSRVCMMLSAKCRRYLWGWWVKMSGSMAYLRMVFMLKALSVGIERVWSSLLASNAMVIAASSALLIACLSG